MPWYGTRLFFIRTGSPEDAVKFFETLGLKFVHEKHGPLGQPHYACQVDGFVFEIYPLKPEKPKAKSFWRRVLDPIFRR